MTTPYPFHEPPWTPEERELLPCRKCGHDIIDEADAIYPLFRDRSVWNVVCLEFEGGCEYEARGSDRQEAIDEWNKR